MSANIITTLLHLIKILLSLRLNIKASIITIKDIEGCYVRDLLLSSVKETLKILSIYLGGHPENLKILFFLFHKLLGILYRSMDGASTNWLLLASLLSPPKGDIFL